MDPTSNCSPPRVFTFVLMCDGYILFLIIINLNHVFHRHRAGHTVHAWLCSCTGFHSDILPSVSFLCVCARVNLKPQHQTFPQPSSNLIFKLLLRIKRLPSSLLHSLLIPPHLALSLQQQAQSASGLSNEGLISFGLVWVGFKPRALTPLPTVSKPQGRCLVFADCSGVRARDLSVVPGFCLECENFWGACWQMPVAF